MEKVVVQLTEHSYDIYIGQNTFATIGINSTGADKIFVLTDVNVGRLHRSCVEQHLPAIEYIFHTIAAGENAKSFENVEAIIEAMVRFGLTRKSLVVAYGGGVIGDLGGFCASIYMRGVRYIQIPTTLLAQTDSSVGGKTGINTNLGKNIVGSFYQPQAVYIDVDLLRSLPEREYRAGVGEIIKYGLIKPSLLDFIRNNYSKIIAGDLITMTFLISECCRIKAGIVSQDEQESGIRKILNIGHTFGHALEVATNYKRYLHGEAVLLGMFYETVLAEKLKLVGQPFANEVLEIIRRTGIETGLAGVNVRTLPLLMSGDKKNVGGKISFILPGRDNGYQEKLLPLSLVEEFCDNL